VAWAICSFRASLDRRAFLARRYALTQTGETERHTVVKPGAAASQREGKTTPSVDLTPPAAAGDLMVLF